MFPSLASQSSPFLSRRFRPNFVVGATLCLPVCALAQPAEREVVAARTVDAVQAPVVPLDPPIITTQELQTLTGGPTLVTFSGTNIPAKDAIQTLIESSKLPSSFPNAFAEFGNVNVNWKDVPFWKAASDLEERAKGVWESDYRGGLYLRPIAGGQTAESGMAGLLGVQTPFVSFIASSVTRTSVNRVLLGNNPRTVTVTPERNDLILNAYFDPKLSVRSVAVRSLKVQNKQNGPVVDYPNNFWGAINGGRTNTLISLQSIALGTPPADTKKIYRINGVLHTTLATVSETWKIPDLAAADKTPTNIGTGKFTVERFEARDGQILITFTIELPAENNALNTLGLPWNTLKVRDSQGRELPSGGSSSKGGENKIRSEMRFSMRSDNNQPSTGPYSLEWVLPTQLRSYDVPFEFRDVFLP